MISAPFEDEASWSIWRMFAAAYRYKWRAVLTFAVVMGGAAAALYLLPEEFHSESKLLVRVGRENAAFDPTITDATMGLTASREVEMNSILEHLRSRTLVEKALAARRPQTKGMPALERDKAIRDLHKRIFVDSPKSSAVVVLHCEAQSAADAQETLAKFVDVFLDEHMRIHQSSGSYDFFVAQCATLEKEVEAARGRLRDAKTEAGVASLEGQRNGLEQQISSTETRIGEIDASLSAIQAKITMLEASLKSVPDSLLGQFVEGTPNDGLAAMRQTLFQLRGREAEILSKYKAPHPDVQSIRTQLERLEKALQDATPDRDGIRKAVLVPELATAKALHAERKELATQLERLHDRLKQFNDIEGQIERLNRQLQLVETRYLAYDAQREQARIDEALHADRITNVSVIQPATFVPTKIRPRKAAVIVLACLVGGLLALSLALLAEQGAATSRRISARESERLAAVASGSYRRTESDHLEAGFVEQRTPGAEIAN